MNITELQNQLKLLKENIEKYKRVIEACINDELIIELTEKLHEAEDLLGKCEEKLRQEAIKPFLRQNPMDLFSVPSDIYKWYSDVSQFLTDERSIFAIDLFESICYKVRKNVSSTKDVSDEDLERYIVQWAKENNFPINFGLKPPPGSLEYEMDKFFAEFKSFGKLDWKYSGGFLSIDLIGQTAAFGYKGNEAEVSAKVSAENKDLTVSASGKVNKKLKLKTELKTDFKDKNSLKVGVAGKKIEGDIKVKEDGKEKSTAVEATGKYKGKDIEVKGGIQVKDKGGEVKSTLSAEVILKDLFRFNGQSGNVSISASGNAKEWSLSISAGTSGGEKAHLSRTAAEAIKDSLRKGRMALQAIHSKVHHALESNEDIETLKAEVEQHWKDVRKALGKLESNIKKPVNRSEVFVTFGLSGGKDQGLAFGAGLTFTF